MPPPPRERRGREGGDFPLVSLLVCMRLTNPDVCHTESRRQSAKQN